MRFNVGDKVRFKQTERQYREHGEQVFDVTYTNSEVIEISLRDRVIGKWCHSRFELAIEFTDKIKLKRGVSRKFDIRTNEFVYTYNDIDIIRESMLGIVVNTDGIRTDSVKKTINELLPDGLKISKRKNDWFVVSDTFRKKLVDNMFLKLSRFQTNDIVKMSKDFHNPIKGKVLTSNNKVNEILWSDNTITKINDSDIRLVKRG